MTFDTKPLQSRGLEMGKEGFLAFAGFKSPGGITGFVSLNSIVQILVIGI
jgi:hypothetical protein